MTITISTLLYFLLLVIIYSLLDKYKFKTKINWKHNTIIAIIFSIIYYIINLAL